VATDMSCARGCRQFCVCSSLSSVLFAALVGYCLEWGRLAPQTFQRLRLVPVKVYTDDSHVSTYVSNVPPDDSNDSNSNGMWKAYTGDSSVSTNEPNVSTNESNVSHTTESISCALPPSLSAVSTFINDADIRNYVGWPAKNDEATLRRYARISCPKPSTNQSEIDVKNQKCAVLRAQPVWGYGNSNLWLGSGLGTWADTRYSAILSLTSLVAREHQANVAWAEKSAREMTHCGFLLPSREWKINEALRGGQLSQWCGQRNIHPVDSCMLSKALSNRYLYLAGLTWCGRRNAIFEQRYRQFLILGILFLEHELFGRGNSVANVLVVCKLGRDRSFALVVFYMCVKFMVQHDGLDRFKSIEDLWNAQGDQVRTKRKAAWKQIHKDVWHAAPLRLLRILANQSEWQRENLSNVLPSLYALPNASALLTHVRLTAHEGLGGLSVDPDTTIAVIGFDSNVTCNTKKRRNR